MYDYRNYHASNLSRKLQGGDLDETSFSYLAIEKLLPSRKLNLRDFGHSVKMNFVREGVLVVADILRQELRKIEKEKRKKRRIWVKKWVQRRDTLGASQTLCKELQIEDEKYYRNMFRMTKDQFEYLLERISSRIQKQHTVMRQPISSRTKLEITLKYLATGDSFQTLSQFFRVPTSTISVFLVDVLQAIYVALEGYIKVPRSSEEWNEIIRGFEARWNFPNCVGAMDGKHVLMKCPGGTGSEFFNYKNSFSIVLLAVVDYNYCFTYIDVGAKGRNSDGGIFNDCSLKRAIETKSLNLPENSVFVGDEAFPLKTYLLKPYPRRGNLTKEQRIYNYRLCRCRRIVENGFGILVSRFRVFEKPITLAPHKVDHIIKAACALHNWLRKTSPTTYTPPGYIDEEHTSVRDEQREISNQQAFQNIIHNYGNSARNAILVREKYCDFFNTEGAVPWQDNAISEN